MASLRSSVAALLLVLAMFADCGVPQARAQAASDTRPPLASLPGLRSCGDAARGGPQVDAKRPVFLLVHGQNGKASDLGPLARALEQHGTQPLCFEYDDRQSLKQTSGQLARTIDGLARHLDTPDITILGHSLGGLVARKALVGDRPDGVRNDRARLQLVTVSAPFSGIASARRCDDRTLRNVTLGLFDLACWVVSGDKWHEITPGSSFIRAPGDLKQNVRRHLVVVTDERNGCRYRLPNGRCVIDDFVFSLAEQQYYPILQAPRTAVTIIQAGHTEVIGRPGAPPKMLVEALVREGFVPAPQRKRNTASGQ